MELTDLDKGRRQRTQTTEAMELTDLNNGATEPTEKTDSALLFARLTGPPLAPGRRPGPEGGRAIRTRKPDTQAAHVRSATCVSGSPFHPRARYARAQRRITVTSTQSNVLRCPPLAPLFRC